MHLGCTVPELLDRVSSRELTEWMAYDQLEPLPDRRQDLLLASLLALLSNVYRDAKSRREPAEPGDFLPWLRLDDDEPEPVNMLAKLEQLNRLFGGEDRRARSGDRPEQGAMDERAFAGELYHADPGPAELGAAGGALLGGADDAGGGA